MVCMLIFWSQNIAQSRYLEEYVFKTPKLFENGPVVIDFFEGKNCPAKFFAEKIPEYFGPKIPTRFTN